MGLLGLGLGLDNDMMPDEVAVGLGLDEREKVIQVVTPNVGLELDKS
jgi:hypothetical protein